MSVDNILWNIRPRSGKINWVDPASFAAMESDTHFLYFTKRSGKSRDFYFLGVIHLNTFFPKVASKQTDQQTNQRWWLHNHSYHVMDLNDWLCVIKHYDGVIMGAIASQITSLTIVYSTVYSGADQSKHQSSSSLAFVWGIHRGPVNSPHKWPVTRKMFSFDDVIMEWQLPSTHLEAVVYGTGSTCAGNVRRGERRREQTNRLRDH